MPAFPLSAGCRHSETGPVRLLHAAKRPLPFASYAAILSLSRFPEYSRNAPCTGRQANVRYRASVTWAVGDIVVSPRKPAGPFGERQYPRRR